MKKPNTRPPKLHFLIELDTIDTGEFTSVLGCLESAVNLWPLDIGRQCHHLDDESMILKMDIYITERALGEFVNAMGLYGLEPKITRVDSKNIKNHPLFK